MPPTPASPDALPHGRFLVVKLGGRLLEEPGTMEALAHDVASLAEAGVRPVLVHGGGPQATSALEASGLPATFHDGLRVTPPEALDVIEPVFAHQGKRLAGALTAAGLPAIALSGRDGALLQAAPLEHLGRVGAVTDVDAQLLRFLAYNGLTPVVGPPAVDPAGHPLNVNADQVAAATAKALRAAALLLLTDVPGVLDDGGSVLRHLTPDDAQHLAGRVAGGMTPKLAAAFAAVASGVPQVHIAPGDAPLADVLAGGPGTRIAREAPA